MAKIGKSWREKLENPGEGLPKVVTGPPKWEKRFGGRKVLVATPLLVSGVIQKVESTLLMRCWSLNGKEHKFH